MLPGTEDIPFLFVSQSYSDTAGSPYNIYELWTHKPERERKSGSEKKLNPHTDFLKTAKGLDMRIIGFKTWQIKDSTQIC